MNKNMTNYKIIQVKIDEDAIERFNEDAKEYDEQSLDDIIKNDKFNEMISEFIYDYYA